MRRIGLRLTRAGRWVPCDEHDPRATIVGPFGDDGWPLMRDDAGRWRPAPGAGKDPMGPDPAEVVAWFEANPVRRGTR